MASKEPQNKKNEKMTQEEATLESTPQINHEESPDESTSQAKKHKQAKGDAAKTAALEAQLDAAKAEAAQIKDQLLRTAAEYENYRRRTGEEKTAAFSHGVEHAVGQMLAILDTLEMAENAPTKDEDYKKGVTLTLQKAQKVFAALGIEEIDCAGKLFDPEVHNACMNEPCEGVASGEVSRVVQKGYTINGRVMRHAMVAVAP